MVKYMKWHLWPAWDGQGTWYRYMERTVNILKHKKTSAVGDTSLTFICSYQCPRSSQINHSWDRAVEENKTQTTSSRVGFKNRPSESREHALQNRNWMGLYAEVVYIRKSTNVVGGVFCCLWQTSFDITVCLEEHASSGFNGAGDYVHHICVTRDTSVLYSQNINRSQSWIVVLLIIFLLKRGT